MNSNRSWAAGAASRRFNTCGFSEEAEELLSGVNSRQLRVKLLNSQSSPFPLNRQRRQSECRIAWFISVELDHSQSKNLCNFLLVTESSFTFSWRQKIGPSLLLLQQSCIISSAITEGACSTRISTESPQLYSIDDESSPQPKFTQLCWDFSALGFNQPDDEGFTKCKQANMNEFCTPCPLHQLQQFAQLL